MFGVSQGKERFFKEPKITYYVTEGQIPCFFLIMETKKRETNLFGITFNKVVYYPLN